MYLTRENIIGVNDDDNDRQSSSSIQLVVALDSYVWLVPQYLLRSFLNLMKH